MVCDGNLCSLVVTDGCQWSVVVTGWSLMVSGGQ